MVVLRLGFGTCYENCRQIAEYTYLGLGVAFLPTHEGLVTILSPGLFVRPYFSPCHAMSRGTRP